MDWVHAIQGPRDQRSFDSSSGIIAVFHALLRLLAPRHPPHALSSLAAPIASSARLRLPRLRSARLPLLPMLATWEKLSQRSVPQYSFRARADSRNVDAPQTFAHAAPAFLVRCNFYRHRVVKEPQGSLGLPPSLPLPGPLARSGRTHHSSAPARNQPGPDPTRLKRNCLRLRHLC